MKNFLSKSMALAAWLVVMSACGGPVKESYGQLTNALDDEAWGVSTWISAADAPVLTKVIKHGDRAADGSSWFVSDVKNDQPCRREPVPRTAWLFRLLRDGGPI